MCVAGRARVLDNEIHFKNLVAFLLGSAARYHWLGRRFVVMPDHIHLIAHQGHEAVRLGQWIKALKAVVGGLDRRDDRPVSPPDAASGDAAYNATRSIGVGGVPPHGTSTPGEHELTRIKRALRWQEGYHDHKFRTPETESRKWEYVCLNPVRYGLVKRPEEWPYGGEIFYDDAAGPTLVRGTPPILETGMLIDKESPGQGTRPTT